MQTLKDVVKAPSRMTPYGRAYYLKPIVSYHSNDGTKTGPKIEFENPRVIYKLNARSPYESILYFNYAHPNRYTGSLVYRRELYGVLCVGSLALQMLTPAIVNSPKYPIILYNFLSTYNNMGYWNYSERNHVCMLCRGKSVYAAYHGQKLKVGDNKYICAKCQTILVGPDGYPISISEIVGEDPKFSWDSHKKKFVYKGKLR